MQSQKFFLQYSRWFSTCFAQLGIPAQRTTGKTERFFVFLFSGIHIDYQATMSLSHISSHEISEDEVKFLESEGRDYCLSHGMVYKDSKGSLQHIPFTLFPSPFSKELFTAAREVQKDFNLLVHKVSQDYEFTKKALLRYEFFV